MADLRRERAELDAAMHTEQENIKRSETNMKEIRTNKEFQAIGREISAARKQVSDLEEQQLQIDTRIEELQALSTRASPNLPPSPTAQKMAVMKNRLPLLPCKALLTQLLPSATQSLKSFQAVWYAATHNYGISAGDRHWQKLETAPAWAATCNSRRSCTTRYSEGMKCTFVPTASVF